MKCYLSGSWARRSELQGYKAEPESMGHENASSWLLPSEYEERDHALTHDEMRYLASQNLDDIHEVDIFIVFTEPAGSSNTRGGRHVEWGYFLWNGAHLDPMPQFAVIGPTEIMFYAVRPAVPFHDFADFLRRAP